MASGQELPNFDFDRALSLREIAKFCDETIWPVVSYYWKEGNFLDTESSNDFVKLDLGYETEEGVFNIQLEARCTPEDCEHNISLHLSRQVVELTTTLIDAAREDPESDYIELDEEELCAWAVNKYYFDTDLSGDIFTKHLSHDLRSLDNLTEWSDTSLTEKKWAEEEAELGFVPFDLNDSNNKTLTVLDCKIIADAFLEIGVPPELLHLPD